MERVQVVHDNVDAFYPLLFHFVYVRRVAAFSQQPTVDPWVQRLHPAIEDLGKRTGIADNGGAQIGRYRIVRRIAIGGMGMVYEAEQANPRRKVALKVIRPGAA